MTGTKTLVLVFAQKKYGNGPDVLKSGDIITITAEGYNELTFKLVIDQNGNATVSADTTPGDIYQLHVKIEGSFEAAIVGQCQHRRLIRQQEQRGYGLWRTDEKGHQACRQRLAEAGVLFFEYQSGGQQVQGKHCAGYL